MGLFSQRPEEPGPWASLPGEPLEKDAVDDLDDTASVDPLEVGLGAETTSITFPVDPPPSETAFRG
ncbi:MAG: hypothetical protein ACTH2E_07610 [Microbacterium sp.]